ncbi:hypothetical protein QBK99_13265 [Corticibacterium sp. UT-5YL-CI-8]|nr:hypothetical protein [Tianweitania sp. UT-5YL-CI-8]
MSLATLIETSAQIDATMKAARKAIRSAGPSLEALEELAHSAGEVGKMLDRRATIIGSICTKAGLPVPDTSANVANAFRNAELAPAGMGNKSIPLAVADFETFGRLA